ncbi:MAG: Fe-S protein assembly chaperone HscA [Magnetococcales bacterium]|nr:Fe-S protein assembly chaperone HscA [Magnetococcales bacterium]
MTVLLDIAEPGQSLKPHEARALKRVVGIDLGTTFSLVAAITTEGSAACIPDEEGRVSVPSIVHYAVNNAPLVGVEAMAMAPQHPQDTIISVKRFMGRGLKDVQAQTPYQLEEGEGGMVRLLAGGSWRSPVEVSAEILRHLHQRAKEVLGGDIHGAVITVPAYFDDAQRQATKDAGRLAGLEVMRLVNEPTAAALAYGLDQGKEGLYAIYDLGGGTFDISILRLHQGVFQVMATGGDSALGGDDFDHRLAQYALQHWGISSPSPGLLQAARRMARQVKEQLSQQETAEFTLQLEDGSSAALTISRSLFEELIEDLVRATGIPCRRAMKDAAIQPEDLQGVVLVGGSTRVPLVRQKVAEWFGQQPLCDLDPDQVVAIGAAHQADLLAGNTRSDLLLLDVNPLSLGIETMGGLVEKIIPRNSPIPCARAQEFTTFKDGQTAMAIRVVQGERETVEQCRALASFELRGIPPMTAGAARIRVTFQVDADGLLTVAAKEQTTGVEQSVAVKPSYGLSDEEIERMLREAISHGAEDIQQRLLREAKVEGERVLNAVSSALKKDMDLLDEEELKTIRKVMREVWEACQGSRHEAIDEAVKQLDVATRTFAQRRMDRDIRQAMAGHRLEEFG